MFCRVFFLLSGKFYRFFKEDDGVAVRGERHMACTDCGVRQGVVASEEQGRLQLEGVGLVFETVASGSVILRGDEDTAGFLQREVIADTDFQVFEEPDAASYVPGGGHVLLVKVAAMQGVFPPHVLQRKAELWSGGDVEAQRLAKTEIEACVERNLQRVACCGFVVDVEHPFGVFQCYISTEAEARRRHEFAADIPTGLVTGTERSVSGIVRGDAEFGKVHAADDAELQSLCGGGGKSHCCYGQGNKEKAFFHV